MNRGKFVGKVDNLDWNSKKNTISLSGYCYVEGFNQRDSSSVKKSIILQKGEKKYLMPLKNTIRDLKNSNEYNCDYRYCGFAGSIDLGFVDGMDSLSEGIWDLKLNIITNQIEMAENLPFDGTFDDIVEKKIINVKENCIVSLRPIMQDGVLKIESVVDSKLENVRHNNGHLKSIMKAFYDFLKAIKYAFMSYLYNSLKKMPIKNNVVLFLSDSRTDLDGNFKFVYDEINKRGGYKIKTFLQSSISDKLGFVDKFRFLYAIATSKYILLDDFYPKIYNFKLREGIELVQLWHACGAFKTFGFSRLGKEGGPKMRSKNHRNYTKAIVSSEDIRKHYAEGFGISEDKVFATGIPRTDIFFDEEYKSSKIKELTEKYPLIKDKKVIMFAPTFRGNGQQTAYYDFDKLNIDDLYNELCNEYVIIMKLHPFIKNVPTIDKKYEKFIIDLSSEREINDLLFVSDILITDYSSVCFEYSLLNRPMIFFAYDMEEYIEKRDFYYPYKGFVPGPIVKTTEGIINIIKNNNFELDKLEGFRNRFFNHFDGKSTERVVDMLFTSDKK